MCQRQDQVQGWQGRCRMHWTKFCTGSRTYLQKPSQTLCARQSRPAAIAATHRPQNLPLSISRRLRRSRSLRRRALCARMWWRRALSRFTCPAATASTKIASCPGLPSTTPAPCAAAKSSRTVRLTIIHTLTSSRAISIQRL